jgi:D-sedoheptulose 7-phosphate isomerase
VALTSPPAVSVARPQLGAREVVRRRLEESIALSQRLLRTSVVDDLAMVAEKVVDAYRAGNKVLFFGNGGSAADATHLAGEMCGRFLFDRRALPAIALADNVASVTAIANDYSFADVFARQIEGFGRPGDVAVGISTSGESENVIKAVQVARRNGLVTVAFTGGDGGRLAREADLVVCVPNRDTPRIQEAHTLLGHVLCELVEDALFGAGADATRAPATV